jgi:hypothetical protein
MSNRFKLSIRNDNGEWNTIGIYPTIERAIETKALFAASEEKIGIREVDEFGNEIQEQEPPIPTPVANTDPVSSVNTDPVSSVNTEPVNT